MGIDSIKQKVAATVGKAVEAVKVEAKKIEAEIAPAPAKKAAEGFDTLKKKIVSVTGGFRAHKPMVSERNDLKEAVSGQRLGIQANAGGAAAPAKDLKAQEAHVHGADCGCGPTLKDGTLNTASSKGADPGPRAVASDFTAQATAANKGATPADIDKAANASARAAIEKDFGLKVKDGDKPWTTEELSRAHESFAAMPAGDQDKLKGLDLIRNGKASAKSQAEMGDKGTIAGEYLPNSDTTAGKRDKPGAIQLYDAAFPAKGADSRKQSMHVIIHEAGHAVEGRKRDDAVAVLNEATDKSNAANDTLGPAIKANNASIGEPDPKGVFPPGSTNRAGVDFGTVSTKDKPGTAYLNSQKAVMSAVNTLQDAKTPAAIATAQTALDTAKAKRDTALAGMAGHPKEQKAKDLAAATDRQEVTGRAQAEANAAYLPLKKDTDAKMKDLKAVATVTETVGDDGKKKLTTSSNELASFDKAKGKEGSVSGYGASKGPEGYAEAYALYQRDPATMKKDFPNQYKFFHAKHKNAND